jgi:ABC-type transport system involved in cytochrome c biogenesis ATPase subunit
VTSLVFERVSLGPLAMIDARFEPGLTIVTGDSSTALAALVALMAGVERARYGRVALDRAEPYSSAEMRRRIGALLAREDLPGARTVAEAVERVLAARGATGAARAALQAGGLSGWANRRVVDLSPAETRAVSLALALSHPSPLLLTLYEPFQAGAGPGEAAIREGLVSHASGGAIVVVATTSDAPLRAVAAQRLALVGGFVRPFSPGPATLSLPVSLRAETSEPRILQRALADDPDVTGVHWDEVRAPGTIVVFGSDLERVAGALSRASESSGAPLTGIGPAAPAFVDQRARYAREPVPAPAAWPGPAAPPHPSMQGPEAPPHPGLPAAAPLGGAPDQSVSMPAKFADPRRPGRGSEHR